MLRCWPGWVSCPHFPLDDVAGAHGAADPTGADPTGADTQECSASTTSRCERTTPPSPWARPRNYYRCSPHSYAASTRPASSNHTRSSGGHRRYSRRQLELAARIRALFDEGMTLDSAARIVGLRDELERTRCQRRVGSSLSAPSTHARIDELGATRGDAEAGPPPTAGNKTQGQP